jgi:hypothetical protein
MQTIDPKNLPTRFKITEARLADVGEHPRLLDGLLYIGATVLYSEPGLGKSMLAAAIEEHLAFARPFGGWTPERPCRCLVVDLEGDMRLAAERSLTNTPFGLLHSDHGRAVPADIEYETEWPGTAFEERLTRLAVRLEEAREAGHPYGYVRIDTLRLFLGGKPHGVNAYEWDATQLGRLNKLANHFDVALVLVHHTNKAGEVSGSTGVAGSVTVVCQLKQNPDNPDECLLVSHKIRVDTAFRYPLVMDDRGRWHFTEEITATQAQLIGTKRELVNLLTRRGPMVLADFREALVNYSANTIKSALRRLSTEGIAVYRRGRWELSQATLQDHPACRLCGTAMEAFEPGQTVHPTCSPDPSVDEAVKTWLGTPTIPHQPQHNEEVRGGHPVDEEHQDEPEPELDHPEVAKFPAFAELRASIEASRMKPLPCVPKIERDALPWTLCVEQMDGAHQSKAWAGPVPEGTESVVLLDRNGSFPSACSSVPIAPNKLQHTGPLGADPLARENRAGLFQIVPPAWDADERGIPHPLGRLAYGPEGEPVWVTSSHIEFLDKLARDGLVPVVDVLDSWTGRRNTSLFERFYKWSKTVREQTAKADPEARVAAKRAISTAIRSLHPKRAKSPFYRPDWHKAITAQASVRHWATAWRAVQGGAALLSIGATDEVAFAVPADAPAPGLWVPAPYRLGAGFGEVKYKEIKVDGEEHMSPVTLELWQARGRRVK